MLLSMREKPRNTLQIHAGSCEKYSQDPAIFCNSSCENDFYSKNLSEGGRVDFIISKETNDKIYF